MRAFATFISSTVLIALFFAGASFVIDPWLYRLQFWHCDPPGFVCQFAMLSLEYWWPLALVFAIILGLIVTVVTARSRAREA
jgi:hypothetical protein